MGVHNKVRVVKPIDNPMDIDPIPVGTIGVIYTSQYCPATKLSVKFTVGENLKTEQVLFVEPGCVEVLKEE